MNAEETGDGLSEMDPAKKLQLTFAVWYDGLLRDKIDSQNRLAEWEARWQRSLLSRHLSWQLEWACVFR